MRQLGVTRVEVRLIGPVEARAAERTIALGPPQQRCVFAVLAMTPRQTVPLAQIIDRVWGDPLPRNVRTVLYTYVSRLRGALAHGGADRELLRRRDGGYALDIDPDRVDLHRARRLAGQGRAVAGQPGGAEQAAQLLAEACTLWAGTALTGINGEWAERVRVGLAHENLTLLTERFEAALRVDQSRAVIGPLSQVVAANPLSESLAGLLMVALHRTGRHADALAHYADLRRRLINEVGDEPGPALRKLHEQILRRDQTLGPVMADVGAPAPVSRQPEPSPPEPSPPEPSPPDWAPQCQLPPGTWHFVGRDGSVDRLVAQLRDAGPAVVPVILVNGPAGVGKTTLATHVAQLVRHRFPDGQWFVRLGGVGRPRDPAQVLADLLETSGVPGSAIPPGPEQRTAALRARLADRRVLLLLDDAADAAQVRPLLPGTPGAAVLVTSRQLLGGLGASHTVRLGPLSDEASMELLTRLAGPDRLAHEPVAAAEVSASCGGLPLALRIAAARLAIHPEWPVERFAARLRDRRRLLDELAVDDLAVRPSLDLSVHALRPELRRGFRWLGLLGGHDVASWTVGALVGGDGERAVEALVEASLLDNTGTDRTGEPRYRLHELVAAYAAEAADRDSAIQRTAPLRRWLAALLHLADTAYQRLHVDVTDLPAAAVATAGPAGHWAPAHLAGDATVGRLTADPSVWLAAERHHLVAAIERACEHGHHRAGALLAERVLPHLVAQLGIPAVGQIYHTVRDAAGRAGDELVEWRAECHRCMLATTQGVVVPTAADLLKCAEAFERLGARAELAYSLTIAAACDQIAGDLTTARHLAERAVAVAASSGSPLATATAEARLARLVSAEGAYPRALTIFSRALRLADEAGRSPVTILSLMVGAALEHDDLDRAEVYCRRALSLADEVHAARTRAWLLTQSADIATARGAARAAVELARDAAARFAELGDVRGEASANVAAARAYLAVGEPAAAAPLLAASGRAFDALGLRRRHLQVRQLLARAA
jgi:DNA-binding SARP family transcriptional activator/tetratricopeptide (TPR) repeat protein